MKIPLLPKGGPSDSNDCKAVNLLSVLKDTRWQELCCTKQLR